VTGSDAAPPNSCGAIGDSKLAGAYLHLADTKLGRYFRLGQAVHKNATEDLWSLGNKRVRAAASTDRSSMCVNRGSSVPNDSASVLLIAVGASAKLSLTTARFWILTLSAGTVRRDHGLVPIVGSTLADRRLAGRSHKRLPIALATGGFTPFTDSLRTIFSYLGHEPYRAISSGLTIMATLVGAALWDFLVPRCYPHCGRYPPRAGRGRLSCH